MSIEDKLPNDYCKLKADETCYDSVCDGKQTDCHLYEPITEFIKLKRCTGFDLTNYRILKRGQK